MTANFDITRPGKGAGLSPPDLQSAARMIVSTGPDLFEALFGQPLQLVQQLLPRPHTVFSAELAFLARRQGMLAGIAMGYDTTQRKASQWDTGVQTVRFLGLRFLSTLRVFRRVERSLGMFPKDAWYLAHLAVDEPFRGQGLGRLLLHQVEDLAASRGLAQVTLDVASGSPAIRLYEAAGYRETLRTDPLKLADRDISFSRMAKRLGQVSSPT